MSLEIGAKRTFACATEWPGWCRSGRDEDGALAALLASAPRYARIVKSTTLRFAEPESVADLRVTERLRGNATTDFGAPGAPTRAESAPVSDTELARLRTLLEAGWNAFDRGVKSASGRQLRKGPRGGGRSVDAIVEHVRGAEAGYLSGLGWPFKSNEPGRATGALKRTRAAVLDGLAASVRGEIAATGPRGGKRWTGRFFVRRLAWHTIDHLWEIEDRLE